MAATATINGIRIYYEQHGEAGPHLVLINGLGTSTWLWEKNIPALAKHFRVLAFDNRGAGYSDKPPGPYSIAQMSADLTGLMEYLGISRAHILGVSMGGYVAQEFALTHPEMVDRLVLVATGPGSSVQVPMSAEVLELLMKPSLGDGDLIRQKFRLAFTEAFLEKEMSHLVGLRLATPQPPEAYLAQARAGAAFDRYRDLPAIAAPCLIVAATGDVVVPVENARILAGRIPNSQLKIYQGFAHQFIVENAREFNRDLIQFLTGS